MRHARRRARTGFAPAVAAAAIVAVCFAVAVAPAGAKSKPTKRHHVTSAMSGVWSGQYGGAFSGTFVLHWTQSGSSLSGTIKLSNPSSTLDVHGSLQGSSINFGTVGGGDVITYTGTVSGKSMSGSYKTPKGGGSWSATKTS